MSNRPIDRAHRWWRIIDQLLAGPPGSVPRPPVVPASVTEDPIRPPSAGLDAPDGAAPTVGFTWIALLAVRLRS